MFLKILDKTEKTVKLKYSIITIIIIGIIGVVWMISVPFYSNKKKNEFFKLEINSIVVEIKKYPSERLFLLDSTWYNIKTNIIDTIQIGDSIIKKSNCSNMLIKDNKNTVKFSGEPKVIIIESISPKNNN